MPYQIVKVSPTKFYVNKVGSNKMLSKEPLDYTTALKQLRAVVISEKDKLKGDGFRDIYEKAKNVFYNDRSFTLERYEKAYGNYIVTDIGVHRTPVESILKKLLSVISLGKFDKVYKSYDEIYHLFIILRLLDPVNKRQIFIQMEKRPNVTITQVPNITSKDAMGKNSMYYHINGAITFKTMMDDVRKKEGKNLFKYTPNEYNCQQFILSIVHSLGVKHLDMFIFQDKIGDYLTGHTKIIATGITDLGHLVNRLQGSAFSGGTDTATGVVNVGTTLANIGSDVAADAIDDVLPIPIGSFIQDNAEGLVNAAFGIKSHLLPSAAFSQEYGNNYNAIIERYGEDSDVAEQFRELFPERLTNFDYLYNIPQEPDSGFLNGYPQPLQALYIYSQGLSSSNYVPALKAKAKQLGLSWNSPYDPNVQKVGQLSNIHSYLSVHGEYPAGVGNQPN